MLREHQQYGRIPSMMNHIPENDGYCTKPTTMSEYLAASKYISIYCWQCSLPRPLRPQAMIFMVKRGNSCLIYDYTLSKIASSLSSERIPSSSKTMPRICLHSITVTHYLIMFLEALYIIISKNRA